MKLDGNIPHRELYFWYCAAHLFVWLAIVKVGQMSLWRLLLAVHLLWLQQSGGIPEIIHSNELGLLTERNERDLADKISLALKKTWSQKDILGYARGLTWDKTAQSLYDVFRSVLSS